MFFIIYVAIHPIVCRNSTEKRSANDFIFAGEGQIAIGLMDNISIKKL